jgi:hypothetical protein
MALLAMKHRKDNANAQGYLDGHAARALQNAAVRVNVLAASCCQEEDAHTKAFASEANKRTRWEITLRATQLQYVAQLGFMSSSKFFAWVAECNASRDGAVVEAPNRTLALAEKALAKEQHCHKAATQEKALANKAHEQHRTAKHAMMLAVMVQTKLKAAPIVRYDETPPTQFFPTAHHRRGSRA